MYKSINKNNRRITILLILIIGLTIANFATINVPMFSVVPSTDTKSDDNIIPIKNEDSLGTAAYSETIEQTGDNIAITQHQSILKQSNSVYEITNFNSVANRSFEID